MALDLARECRALSVFAISPAGMWPPPEEPGSSRPRAKLLRALKSARMTRFALPLLYRSASVREFAFRDVNANGRSLSPELALALTDDMLGCEIAQDMLATGDYLAPIDPRPARSRSHGPNGTGSSRSVSSVRSRASAFRELATPCSRALATCRCSTSRSS